MATGPGDELEAAARDLPTEVELRTAAIEGRPVRRGDPQVAAISGGQAWGDDRIVRADLLFELLARTESTQKPRAVVLVGLRITGRLNFEAAELCAPLIANNCYFDEPVNFTAARAPMIALTACRLRGVAADQLETRANLELDRSVADTISLLGAHIGGRLSLNGVAMAVGSYPLDLAEGGLRSAEVSDLRGALDGVSVMAHGLRVDGDMFCRDGFSAAGEVHLSGAHIVGVLVFDGAALSRGLFADGLRVDLGMLCRQGFSAGGEVRLLGGQVGGQLDFERATLHEGLDATGLRVEGDMLCRDGFSANGEVCLFRAQIAGLLSFTWATLSRGLLADRLRVDGNMLCPEGFSADGEVRLAGAHIAGQLSFQGATLHEGLEAAGLRVDGDMLCGTVVSAPGQVHAFSADGDVCLDGAQVGGKLAFEGATLRNRLDAERLRVDGSMLCVTFVCADREVHRFSADGEVRLSGAHIAGQLEFAGAALGEVRLFDTHVGGLLAFVGATLSHGLAADGLQVDGPMLCQGFSSAGEVRLAGAHIGGQLSLNGARLRRDVFADRLRVDGDMLCGEDVSADCGVRRFSADGEVRLFGAHIAGSVSFNGAANVGPGLALNLREARIDDSLDLRFMPSDPTCRRGMVDLTGSQVGKLVDNEETWPATLRLRGCKYGGIGGGSAHRSGLARALSRTPLDVRQRLSWIHHAEESESYARQPYTQLMSVYRQEGRDADARRVAYDRERRRRGQLGPLGKAWNFFLQWTVGYGYRPLLALAWLVALVFVGSLAFSSFHSDGNLTAVKQDHPPFVATIYTLDRLVPIVSFGLRDAFAPAGAAQWWAFAYTILGWALTTAVVAGVTTAVRRD